MSYAGPVFPLTLREADGDITAAREITLDFTQWMIPGEGGYAGRRPSDLETALRAAAELTIPAGESVYLAAEMAKVGSCDFYCAHTENRGVYGYDMVTESGSDLICTEQAAVLKESGQLEIVRQNFGFDPDGGVGRVTLDPRQEHYYLEVKYRGDRTE